MESDEDLIERALRAASHTRRLVVELGARHRAADAFDVEFGRQSAIVVTDRNTLEAAGRDVLESFRSTGQAAELFVFGPHIYADDRCADELTTALAATQATPVAVGAGTINDLTKLASHRVGRPYMVVATAASMDGYTAYGASITAKGSKQTFDCPAPRAVLADLEVIAQAPAWMNASGYADLLAKVAAGADWIIADAIGIEPIDRDIWNTVQQHLHSLMDSPEAIARGEPLALRRLVYGLMMSGFAMQAARSSRPASGAEHQFSHLWDMQHHTHDGAAPSHGFKVGIGTLASVALYEELFRRDLGSLDVEKSLEQWPSLEGLGSQIAGLLGSGELADKARDEMRAKYVPAAALRQQLETLRAKWPEIRESLARQLILLSDVRAMLQQAGCPTQPEQIGITRTQLRQSYWQSLLIRRRFTVLDLAHRAGMLEASLENMFAPGGGVGADMIEKLAGIRHVVLDLDGTLYRGERLFEATLPFLERLRAWRIGYTFLTNNTSRSKADYVAKLAKLGINTHEEQIYTPADSAIVYLREQLPDVKAIFVLGTPSLCQQFEQAGFNVTWQSPQAVIVGFDMTLTYERLCRAAYWISKGLPYIATHPDLVCPTDEPTVLVDCGSICACLTAATGRSPLVLGKPDPRILLDLAARHGVAPQQLAMVGDRLYTDVAMARAAEALAVLVLSGEATAEQAAASTERPDLVVQDIGEFSRQLEQALHGTSNIR